VRWRRLLIEHGGAAGLSLIAGVVALKLWGADLRVPFDYNGDALYFAMVAKSVTGGGWFLTNPHLGAPGVLQMHDFPSAEAFHLLVLKAMSWLCRDWAVLFNGYFLLGFPLITVASLAVLRHFRVSYGPALAVSILYAFLPSRLLKGEGHYFLDIFWQVPLAVLVALWVCGDDPPLVRAPRPPGRWPRLEAPRGRGLAAIAICLVTSATGIYYAFFAGVLIVAGGLWASIDRRTPRNALAGVLLTGVIVAGLGVQAAPIAAHQRRHGPNVEVAARQPQEAEIFGMRIAELLSPVTDHRVPALRQLKRSYDAHAPFPGESSMTSLGLVASAGFLALLALTLLPGLRGQARGELVRALAALNLSAVLLATTGGFGSLFALLVTPNIRGYARMHAFVAFFALFAVALLLERAGTRRRWLAALLPAAVAAVGLYDQVTPPAVRAYDEVAAIYDADRAFVRGVEAALPAGAMVFELPHQQFPEGAAVPGVRGIGYEMLRPYFHSTSLRWSYPAMVGRAVDAWTARVSALPAPDMLRELADAGFDGIYLDRHGYLDGAVEAALAAELGAPPVRSRDGRLSFFDLRAHNELLLAGVSADERERRRDLAAHPLLLRWTAGCYGTEHAPEGPFHWCPAAGVVEIDNGARTTRRATVAMRFVAAHPPAKVTFAGDLLSETVVVGAEGLPFSRTLTIPPGRHLVRLAFEGEPADGLADPRHLIVRAENPTLDEIK
jgi:phosphoglycerol transferase